MIERSFIHYVCSVDFTADDLQWLADQKPAAFAGLQAGLERGGLALASPVTPQGLSVPLEVELEPITERARQFRSYWGILAGYPRAFPYRCRVTLPLRRTAGASAPRREWSSLKAECFVSTFGVAAHVRFGFAGLAREQASAWPARRERFVMESGGTGAAWQGTEHELLGLVARCAMAALGPAYAGRIDARWPSEFEKGTRRVYVELRESDDWNAEADRKLLYGLARRVPQYADRDTAAVMADSFVYRPKGKRKGEGSLFTPGGAALLRVFDGTEESESEALCQAHNVVHALSMHGLLTRPLARLGSPAGAEEAFKVANDPQVGSIERERLEILAQLHRSYGWMAYYSARHRLASFLAALPENLRAAIVPPGIQEELLARMSSFGAVPAGG